MGAYMLVGLGAYGVGLIMVFTFGAMVAIDRGQKNDLLMRATPLPPAVDRLRTSAQSAFSGREPGRNPAGRTWPKHGGNCGLLPAARGPTHDSSQL
jgi:hypothetical protein